MQALDFQKSPHSSRVHCRPTTVMGSSSHWQDECPSVEIPIPRDQTVDNGLKLASLKPPSTSFGQGFPCPLGTQREGMKL